MRKNAFTLIELLAVIVILAIIALIAVPVIVNIITDSKASSEKESIKIYLDTVEKAIARRMFAKPSFNPTECTISGNKEITCGTEKIEIDIKGEVPSEGTIKFGNGMIIEGINLKLNGLYYQVTGGKVSEGTVEKVFVVGEICTGGGKSITIGTKYSCEVKPGKSFDFYVLSKDGDNVNLIMDRNICSSYSWEGNPNGEPARGEYYYGLTDEYVSEICAIDWTDYYNNSHYSNNYGPTGAMMGLYVATKDWSNVPDMIMNYTDENNTSDSTEGYTSIITDKNTKVTTITGKQDEYLDSIPVTTIGTTSEPLKARLPMFSEVTSEAAGCVLGGYYDEQNFGTCASWLVDYLYNYGIYEENHTIDSVYGYWLLSSYPDESSYALRIVNYGYVDTVNIFPQDDYTGIRPVITVPTSALGN